MGQTIQVTSQDSHQFSSYVSQPAQHNGKGIVLIQEIFGVTEQMRELADQYAEKGFKAIVPALFERVSDDTVFSYDEPKKGLALVGQCQRDKLLLDIQAAQQALECEQVSVIGFCWGGGIAYLAASKLSLHSGAAFYGTRLTSYLPDTPACPFQFHFGETDSHTPPEVIQQMQQAAPNAEIFTYPETGHAFANAHRPSYHQSSAELATERVVKMLRI